MLSEMRAANVCSTSKADSADAFFASALASGSLTRVADLFVSPFSSGDSAIMVDASAAGAGSAGTVIAGITSVRTPAGKGPNTGGGVAAAGAGVAALAGGGVAVFGASGFS
jgi:hypothetical protein